MRAPSKFIKISIKGLKIRIGVSFLEIEKFILFALEKIFQEDFDGAESVRTVYVKLEKCFIFPKKKIFQGVYDGAKSVPTVLHSYLPSREGFLNGG